eukprot:4198721-Prymnesium_polylepis.1
MRRAQAKLDGISPARKPKALPRVRLPIPELALVGRRIKLRGLEGHVLTYLPHSCQVAVQFDDDSVLNVWLSEE